MFTGIIHSTSKVLKYDRSRLETTLPFRRLQLGESISLNGVCLTVAALGANGRATFDVGPETARVTTLGRISVGARINVERALRYGDSLGGHWVTGHIENTARITALKRDGRNYWLSIELPRAMRRWVVAKGSLTVDGISLTVVSVLRGVARFMIVPHTWAQTNLADRKIGDHVNVEPDILAKYARVRASAGPAVARRLEKTFIRFLSTVAERNS